MARFLLFPALLIICTMDACKQYRPPEKISFYYWKQADDFTSSTAPLIQKYNVQRFYVHVLDVVWNGVRNKEQPIALSHLTARNPVTNQEIIPVIFIQNNVMLQIAETAIDSLAGNILQAAQNFMRQFPNREDLSALQIDCDWTTSSRHKYFLLLKKIKARNHALQLSATIRLYPYKYHRKMGVPPVDYGVLMCYNLNPVTDKKTENAIFTVQSLKAYLKEVSYPLPLIPILPVFGWQVWFSGDQYKGIVYGGPGLTKNPIFKPLNKHLYVALKDTLIQQKYIRKGDVLRNEFPSIEELQQAISIIYNTLNHPAEIIYYYWEEKNMAHYEKIF